MKYDGAYGEDDRESDAQPEQFVAEQSLVLNQTYEPECLVAKLLEALRENGQQRIDNDQQKKNESGSDKNKTPI